MICPPKGRTTAGVTGGRRRGEPALGEPEAGTADLLAPGPPVVGSRPHRRLAVVASVARPKRPRLAATEQWNQRVGGTRSRLDRLWRGEEGPQPDLDAGAIASWVRISMAAEGRSRASTSQRAVGRCSTGLRGPTYIVRSPGRRSDRHSSGSATTNQEPGASTEPMSAAVSSGRSSDRARPAGRSPTTTSSWPASTRWRSASAAPGTSETSLPPRRSVDGSDESSAPVWR